MVLSARLDVPPPIASKAAYALRELTDRIGFGLRLTHADAGDLCYGAGAHPGFRVHVPFEAALYDAGAGEAGDAGGAGRDGDRGDRDPIGAAYRLLTYLDEAGVPDSARDRRDVFVNAALPPARQRTAGEPVVEQHADGLLRLIAERQPRIGEAAEPRWPAGKKYALVMTHDVDAIDTGAPAELATALIKAVARRDASHWALVRSGLAHRFAGGENLFFQFAWWRAWERRLAIRSAFYFFVRRGAAFDVNDCKSDVGGRAADWPLFRAMADEGWEFGVHASIRARHTPRAFAESHEWLAERLERPVVGIRHHYFALDWRRPWRTHREHARAGFKYDSSIAWRDVAGFRTGTSLPHRVFDPERNEIVPLTVLPCGLMDNHVACADVAGTRQPDAIAATRATEMVQRVRRAGGMLVFDWHQETACNRLMYAGYRDVVERIAADVFGDSDAWTATPYDVYRHWTERTARLAASEMAA
jgi:hypothetical protein